MARTATLTALLATAVLALGCNDEDPGEATTALEVVGTDALTFEPDSYTVPAGEQVTLELTSEGAVEHDFVVEDAADRGSSDPHGQATGQIGDADLFVAHADPGETVTATFSVDEAGTFEVYCSVTGHREAGMVGTLTVVD